jgi:hypothetical protein
MGSLVAHSGQCMQSEGETLDLLLATYFPDSVCVEGGMTSAPTCCTNCFDRRLAARIVAYGRVGWAIDSFAPYKSPGTDGIFLALVQEGREVLIPYLIRIIRACLATGYIPILCIQVVFIPKLGRISY